MRTVIVAKALVLDDANNCLVLRRSNTHPLVPLTPDLPGGQLDEDESPQETVIREILEETGLAADPAHTELVYAVTEVETTRDLNLVRLLFVTRVAGVKPAVQISWEHSEAWWTPFANVENELTHPEYLKGIRHILEHDIVKHMLEVK